MSDPLVIYAIIKRATLEDLVKHINAIAKDGWCPHGGVAMAWNPQAAIGGAGAMQYAQAVIRYPALRDSTDPYVELAPV